MTRADLETLLQAKFSYWELSEPHQKSGKRQAWAGKNGNPPPEHYTIRSVVIDAQGVATREQLDAVRIGDEWFVSREDLSARPDLPESRKPDPARS